MKRLMLVNAVLVLALLLAVPAFAQSGPRVRVIHASPDAPAVDVWADGQVAFSNAPFKGITAYATLTQGMHNFKVVPAGATTPVVIEANLDLQNNTDYSIVALNVLGSIEPLVLVDNNALPAAGKAHVRFVHASPDAPAVDIAVAGGGPVLFAGIPFKGVGTYLPVDAGTYDLEVRVAGTNNVALQVPGLKLESGVVYTVFAMGLAGGQPALTAVPSVDAQATPVLLPQTGAVNYNAYYAGILASLGLLMLGFGFIYKRLARQTIKR